MKKTAILGFLTVFFCGSMAEAQVNQKVQALTGGDPLLAVMTSDLLEMRQAVASGKPSLAAMQNVAPHAIRNGQLQCIIGVKEINKDFLAACKTAKLEVVGTYEYPGLNQIVVRCADPRDLDSIARRSEVRVIRPEPMAQVNAGSVANQADVSINTDDARSTYSVNGSGVRVGVLSDSVKDVIGGTLSSKNLTGSTPQTSGDLPASVRVLDVGPGGGTDEGAGMMELIYDLAPSCDLSFASAFTSYASFASNITALRTDAGYQCDVICDDVSYYEEPMYQNGPIAISCNNCYANGVPYFSSAGNNKDNGHERLYVDSNPSTDDKVYRPTGVDFHDFGAAMGLSSDTHLEINMPALSSIVAVLHWDEPYGGGLGAGPGSGADFDMFVVSNTSLPLTAGNILDEGGDGQGTPSSPYGDACEFISYQTTIPRTVYLVIDYYDDTRDGGSPQPTVHFWLSPRSGATITDKYLLTDRTIYGHSAAENATAVAAMFFGEIDLGGGYMGGSELNVETFSSHGGNIPVWFSDNGATRYGTAQTRFKPEITGPDGSNTTFFYSDIAYDADSYPNFFGTSAAAPHAAGVAALMLDYNPALTPAQVYSGLRDTAIDVETAGQDIESGDGLIDAFNAVQGLASVEDWQQY